MLIFTNFELFTKFVDLLTFLYFQHCHDTLSTKNASGQIFALDIYGLMAHMLTAYALCCRWKIFVWKLVGPDQKGQRSVFSFEMGESEKEDFFFCTCYSLSINWFKKFIAWLSTDLYSTCRWQAECWSFYVAEAHLTNFLYRCWFLNCFSRRNATFIADFNSCRRTKNLGSGLHLRFSIFCKWSENDT